jgi:recombination protein RecT
VNVFALCHTIGAYLEELKAVKRDSEDFVARFAKENEMATATTEITTRQKPAVLAAVEKALPQFAGRLAKDLPNGMTPEKFMFGVATAIQKNPALLECEPSSVLLAAYEAAELGINLSPALALGFLVPYAKVCTFQVSYRGLIQKAYETNAVRSLFAECVYKNDNFTRQFAPKRNLFHSPADGDRGEIIGAYAFIEFNDGSVDWEYMTTEQIERRRNHSKAPNSLMWTKFKEEGYRKTPIRNLWKRVPLTNAGLEALAEAVERDAANEIEPEPTGALQLEADSQLHAAVKLTKTVDQVRSEEGRPLAEEPKTPSPSGIFVQVGKALTVVTGDTRTLKDDLPAVGAKWEGKARIWTMPAGRTHELLKVCEAKKIPVTEVDDNGKPIGELPPTQESGEEPGLPF